MIMMSNRPSLFQSVIHTCRPPFSTSLQWLIFIPCDRKRSSGVRLSLECLFIHCLIEPPLTQTSTSTNFLSKYFLLDRLLIPEVLRLPISHSTTIPHALLLIQVSNPDDSPTDNIRLHLLMPPLVQIIKIDYISKSMCRLPLQVGVCNTCANQPTYISYLYLILCLESLY